jgi:hypothetical protein
LLHDVLICATENAGSDTTASAARDGDTVSAAAA